MKTKQLFAGLFMLVALILVAITFNAPGLVIAMAPLAGFATSKSLKEKRSALVQDLQKIIDAAKEEKRDFTEEENTKRSDLVQKIEDLDGQIDHLQKEERIMAAAAGEFRNKENEKREKEEVRKYSILRAIQGVVNGNLDGLEKELHDEAKREAREAGLSLNGQLHVPTMLMRSEKRASNPLMATSGENGGSFVQTDVVGFIEALEDKLVLTELGAQMLDGLAGNIQIPRSGGSAVAWEGENDENAAGDPTIDNVSASPHRLGAYSYLSKQLLNQAPGYKADQLVQGDIIRAIQSALQVAAIEGAGSSDPTGILNISGIGSVVGSTNGAAPTLDHLLDLEKSIASNDADVGTLAYLTNPSVRAKLKKTALDAGSGQMVWDLKSKDELIGYKAGVTTSVPSDLTKGTGTNLSAIIYGNFADMIICQWGGLDIVVDPYSRATYNQVRLVVNSFWDIVIRHAKSFSAMKDAITS